MEKNPVTTQGSDLSDMIKKIYLRYVTVVNSMIMSLTMIYSVVTMLYIN